MTVLLAWSVLLNEKPFSPLYVAPSTIPFSGFTALGVDQTWAFSTVTDSTKS